MGHRALVAHPYTLLGLTTLDAGSWADWFSGTMSAAAVVIALGGYWWSERQRSRDADQRERQAAKQIGIKIFKVLNGTHDIHRHLFAQYTGPKLGGEGANELWRTIQPLIGLTDDPAMALDAAETNLLIEAKQTDFMMEVMLVVARYQSVVSSMREYAVKYEAVYALSPPPYDGEGAVFKHKLTEEQYWRIKPYSVMLEILIQSLRAMTSENLDKCRAVADDYAPIMKNHFNEEKWLTLVEPGPP